VGAQVVREGALGRRPAGGVRLGIGFTTASLPAAAVVAIGPAPGPSRSCQTASHPPPRQGSPAPTWTPAQTQPGCRRSRRRRRARCRSRRPPHTLRRTGRQAGRWRRGAYGATGASERRAGGLGKGRTSDEAVALAVEVVAVRQVGTAGHYDGQRPLSPRARQQVLGAQRPDLRGRGGEAAGCGPDWLY
jgi:hypothetical protein